MSYINENNIYGIRKIKETPPKYYTFGHNELNLEEELVADKECPCHDHKPEKYNHHNEDDNCNKGCNKKDDGWDCTSPDKCCIGDTCVYDPTKVKCVCSYMDIIFSEDTVSGSPLFFNLDTGTGSGYTIKAEYKSLDSLCCIPCTIDTSSQFDIESIKVTIKSFVLSGPVQANSVLVNGTPIVSSLDENSLIANIPTTFLDENCSYCDKGTKVSILLNSLQSWNFIAKIDICGKVTTNSTTCKFKIFFTNDVPDGSINVNSPSTFVAPEICLPNSNEYSPIILDVRFSASSQLIAPSLSAILSDPADPTSIVLTLTGNLILNPSANMQIIQNTKVCFNAMI